LLSSTAADCSTGKKAIKPCSASRAIGDPSATAVPASSGPRVSSGALRKRLYIGCLFHMAGLTNGSRGIAGGGAVLRRESSRLRSIHGAIETLHPFPATPDAIVSMCLKCLVRTSMCVVFTQAAIHGCAVDTQPGRGCGAHARVRARLTQGLDQAAVSEEWIDLGARRWHEAGTIGCAKLVLVASTADMPNIEHTFRSAN
jgi:hypothetical protein